MTWKQNPYNCLSKSNRIKNDDRLEIEGRNQQKKTNKMLIKILSFRELNLRSTYIQSESVSQLTATYFSMEL